MKKWIALVIVAVALSLSAATLKRLYVSWDLAPDYESGVTFYIYSQTNVALPLASWKVLTNVTFETYVAATNRVEIPSASAVPTFYVVTASNLFGESDFSDPVAVRRLSPGKGVKIGAF